jgi:hypothetical protein
MFKAIALALLLVVAVFAQDQPIDTVTSTDSTALNGVPDNLKTLVSQDAPMAIDGRIELTPTEAELAVIRAAVAADPNIAAADLLPFVANLSDIVPIRDNLLATISAAVPAWTAYKAEVVANLTAFLAVRHFPTSRPPRPCPLHQSPSFFKSIYFPVSFSILEGDVLPSSYSRFRWLPSALVFVPFVLGPRSMIPLQSSII